MNPDVSALLALQSDDQVIHELESRLGRLEPRLKELDAQRRAAEASLAEARARADEEAHRLRELEARAAERRQLHERSSSRMDTLRTSRQATAAMSQMDNLQRLLADDEGALQALGRRVDDLRRTVEVHERALADIAAAQATARAEIAEERRTIEEELRHARMKRDGAALRVPRQLLGLYDRVRRRRAPNAVVALRGGSCGSCDVNIPLHRRSTMQRTGKVELCEECGVILYAPE